MQTEINSNLRLMHHVVIGMDRNCVDYHTLDEAYAALKEGITRQCGGTVCFITDGTWTAGSELGDYQQDIEEDIALNFIITLTLEEECAGAWDTVKQVIADI